MMIEAKSSQQSQIEKKLKSVIQSRGLQPEVRGSHHFGKVSHSINHHPRRLDKTEATKSA